MTEIKGKSFGTFELVILKLFWIRRFLMIKNFKKKEVFT